MSHLASLNQLQTPPWAISEGELVAYSDVSIHISAEALTRAVSVFEGIKGYWDDGSTSFAIRALDRHYARLSESARLFEIPMPVSFEGFRDQCDQLAGALVRPDKDLWMRTTLYVVAGHWGEGTRANLVITGFHQPKQLPTPLSLAVSNWRRTADDQMPTRVKSSANYVVARLARIDAHRRGCDDAILLNQNGRVAEATGACVIAARNGTLVTPPTWEGALDSITASVLSELAARRGIPFERRPLDRSELLGSDEVAIAGTISEITPVSRIDAFEFGTDGMLAELLNDYVTAMRERWSLPNLRFETMKNVPADA